MLQIIKKGFYAFAFASLMLFSSASVEAQTFSGPGYTITDGGGRAAASCSIVPVSGITSNVVVNRVTYTSFVHSFIGDLELRVYPPAAAAPPSTTGSQIISSPPDGRACNFNGTYNFTNTGTNSIDAATVGCTDGQTVAPGNYRTSNYGGGTNPGAITNLGGLFGALTPAQANGNWRVCSFDFIAPDGGTVGGTSINFSVFTAAQATVSGRVISMNERGIQGVTVTAIGSNGATYTAVSNTFGFYSFDGLAVGETYTVTANHKRYQFQNPTQVLSLSESISGLDFIAAIE